MEKERGERERETDRQTDRQRERDRDRERGREREGCVCVCVYVGDWGGGRGGERRKKQPPARNIQCLYQDVVVAATEAWLLSSSYGVNVGVAGPSARQPLNGFQSQAKLVTLRTGFQGQAR